MAFETKLIVVRASGFAIFISARLLLIAVLSSFLNFTRRFNATALVISAIGYVDELFMAFELAVT